jgi:bifunctional DNA-binding transcriptional regulator/antitoxin component of YhaV-PrlF toxin-antitoxin module
MPTQTVSVDGSGALILPPEFLRALGLQPDAQVLIEITDQGVIIKPVPPPDNQAPRPDGRKPD